MGGILVVADDLMWSTRLASQATAAGVASRVVSDLTALEHELQDVVPELVVVDLAGRRFDGIAAVRIAAGWARVIAVASHEEHGLRKSAIAAGAARVYAFSMMYADGVEILHDWLERPVDAPLGAR